MILIIDNYDSFTWNLAGMLQALGAEVNVVRNDETSPEKIWEMNPGGIVLSPGPGQPADSGISREVAEKFSGQVPILGICLGHQLLGELAGIKLCLAKEPVHGRTSTVFHEQTGLFEGIPNPFEAMRYHSLILETPLPESNYSLTAWTESGEVMGIKHKWLNVQGLQFHPESILTTEGSQILKNWLAALKQ
jgi:anthranilate synthase component II